METVRRVVLSSSSDLLQIGALYVATKIQAGREITRIADDWGIEFIPTGQIRGEYFRGMTDPDDLEEAGYLFLDREHGLFGQGGNPLAKILDLAGMDRGSSRTVDLFWYLADAVSQGRSIVKDKDVHRSSTPHTPRNLKSVVAGWVIELGEKSSEAVLRGLHMCALADAWVNNQNNLDKPVNRAFLLAYLQTATTYPGMSDKLPVVEQARQALQVRERDWVQGEADFLDNTTTRRLEVEVGFRAEKVRVVRGVSDTISFGAHAAIAGAEVVIIYHRGHGRFTVYTPLKDGSIPFIHIAARLRKLDLENQGIELDRQTLMRLGQPGKVLVTDPRDASQVEALYFTEAGDAIGDGIRGCPNPRRASLEFQPNLPKNQGEEVLLAVIAALQEYQ